MSSLGTRPAGVRHALLRQPIAAPLLYAASLGLVEVTLIAPGHVLAGQILDALLVLMLANAGSGPARDEAPSAIDPAVPALRVLGVLALVRVMTIGLPLRDGSVSVATLVVSLLAIGAGLAISPFVSISVRDLVVPRAIRLERSALLAGVILGLVAYLAGAPRLWHPGASADRVVVGLVASITGACADELLFRGLMQGTLQRISPRHGLIATALLYACFVLGAGSPELVLVLALAGAVFSRVVDRTDSLRGVLAGHAALALGAGAVWPELFGSAPGSFAHSWVLTTLLALLLAGVAARTVRPAVAIRRAAATGAARPIPAAGSPPSPGAGSPPSSVAEPAAATTARSEPQPRATTRPSLAEAGRQLAPGDVELTLACARAIGVPTLLSDDPCWERDLCVAAVVQAVVGASPARAPLRNPRPRELRKALTWLAEREERIERHLADRYLVGRAEAPLYHVRSTPEMTYGVLSDQRGRPIATALHAQESAEPQPLIAALVALRERLGLDGVIVIGEHATEIDLDGLAQLPDVGWIVAAAPAPSQDLIPGELTEEPREWRPAGLSLQVGGIADRLGGARAAMCFMEATRPALQASPRIAPEADGSDMQRAELITSLLGAFIAWHLVDALAELLADPRVPERDEGKFPSLTELLGALRVSRESSDAVVAGSERALRSDARGLLRERFS